MHMNSLGTSRPMRFPRLSSKDEVEKLVAETRELMSGLRDMKVLYRDQQIKIGRNLWWIKLTFTKHGEWQRFYRRHFTNTGIKLRRAQKYMQRFLNYGQKRPEAFLPGRDAELDEAVEQHKKDIKAAPRTWLSPHLHFSDEAERKTMDELWKSDKQLEEQTVDLWRQKYREWLLRRAA